MQHITVRKGFVIASELFVLSLPDGWDSLFRSCGKLAEKGGARSDTRRGAGQLKLVLGMVTESFRLGKTLKMIKSNHQPYLLSAITKPCPSVPPSDVPTAFRPELGDCWQL